MKKLLPTLIILLVLSCPLLAAEDYYAFKTSEQQQRFQSLTTELRCLVCQNQNLSESNAPLANDLRSKIYEQIQQGQTDQQIVDYLVSRYGNFILYRPPFKAATIALWFGPFLLLFMGMIYLIYYIHQKRRD